MAKKRRKLDEFLSQRRKSQEVALEEKTQLSNRLFHLCAGIGFTLILAIMAIPSGSAFAYDLGLGLLFFLLMGLVAFSLARSQPGLFRRPAAFNQLICLIVVEVLLYELIKYQVVENQTWSVFLTPLPLFGMVGAMVFSEGSTLLLGLALAFYMGVASPHSHPNAEEGLNRINSLGLDVNLLIVLAVGVATAALTIKPVRRQSKPVVVGLYAGLAQAFTLLFLRFGSDGDSAIRMIWSGAPGGELDHSRLIEFLKEPSWAFAGGLLSGALVTCLLPAIERFFEILTERRLLDLSDFSNDLLRLIQERAPGTFQHTLNVAQLTSSAAEAIGADPLLARVGAYYHDLGKIHKPEYFVENMGEDKTIHERLSPSMSKMIIISHVKDGVVLAKEAKLPQKMIDMIPMHHGTTLVEFFYHKARRAAAGGVGRPGEVEYRYPGPKPRFREAGIMMLADTLEAMAKAESHPNPSRFRAMAHEVMLKRLLDGQLDESDLTLNDLRKIEDSFARTLATMYHGRIKYPTDDPDDVGGAAPPGRKGAGGGPSSTKTPPASDEGAGSDSARGDTEAESDRPDAEPPSAPTEATAKTQSDVTEPVRTVRGA